MVASLTDDEFEPSLEDELFLFSLPRFDVLQYILQFHMEYILNPNHGLTCKLRQLTQEVDCKLGEVINDQRISLLKVRKKIEDGLQLQSSERLIRLYKNRLELLIGRSMPDLHLPLFQYPCQNILSEFEIDFARKMIENGKIAVAIDALIAANQLASSLSQKLRMQEMSERLKVLLLCKIHRQKALSQSKLNKWNKKSIQELTSNLSMLVALGKRDDAISAPRNR